MVHSSVKRDRNVLVKNLLDGMILSFSLGREFEFADILLQTCPRYRGIDITNEILYGRMSLQHLLSLL